MGHNTYFRRTVTGGEWHSRKGTQGRRSGIRKVKFSARVSAETKQHVQAQAMAFGITPSRYADIALSLFSMDSVGQELVKS